MSHSREEMLRIFEDTRPIHHGKIDQAAPILGMTEESLERALYRARKAGVDVAFTAYSRRTKW